MTALILVHGITSSADVWVPLTELLSTDDEFDDVHVLPFEYLSPRVSTSSSQRIPDLDTVADQLATFLGLRVVRDEPIVFVGHSMGGLVIQRYLHNTLAAGDGARLSRVHMVVLVACPNAGSNHYLLARRLAGLFVDHRQEHDLRPLAVQTAETSRYIQLAVVNADAVSATTCPIPIIAYAAADDAVVTPQSARGAFPRAGTLPGDHSSVVAATSTDDLVYRALTGALREARSRDHELVALSRRNRRLADALLEVGAPGRRGLRLHDLYVPRTVESELRTDRPGLTVLAGDAGIGKTSLLWRLAKIADDDGREPVFLRASDLLDRDGPATTSRLRAALAQRPAVPVLIDTVDLLIRSGELPTVLLDLVDAALTAGTFVVMTCRKREAHVLRALQGHQVTLGPYDDDELARAVRGHGQRFGIEDGSTIDELRRRILASVARDLPLVEVCRQPLTLRLLIELVAAGVEVLGETAELDTTELYQRYWDLRVCHDRRDMGRADDAVDASAAAHLLAVLMLAVGRPALDRAWVDREADSVEADLVSQLRHRGIVQPPDDNGPSEFFHQTFFEPRTTAGVLVDM